MTYRDTGRQNEKAAPKFGRGMRDVLHLINLSRIADCGMGIRIGECGNAGRSSLN
jgi:hypothetical protein